MSSSLYSLKGQTAAVLGAGVSNRPLIDFLCAHGAHVTVRDRRPKSQFEAELPKWEAAGVRCVFGEGYLENLTESRLFRSPGMRYDLPELVAAVKDGSILTSEMELFFALCPCPIIGISGSDGKTTTTTLISRFLSEYEGRVFLGGNIGTPLLPRLSEMQPGDLAVVELSSFQLHTMRTSPTVAVLTNLSPNHLDYHRDFAEYVDAKRNLLRYPSCRTVVLNSDDPVVRGMTECVPESCEIRRFGHGDPSCTVYEKEGEIYAGQTVLLHAEDMVLPGRHNLENYMAACAACLDFVSPKAMQRAARTFGGVEHRLQTVGTVAGVRYINSSIDSTPTRTVAALWALSNLSGRVIVLLGGYDKHIPFAPLAQPLARIAKAAMVTGATSDAITAALLADAEFVRSGVPIVRCTDLAASVKRAHEIAKAGDVVLLSPACASFDAFENFEARGRCFQELVSKL